MSSTFLYDFSHSLNVFSKFSSLIASLLLFGTATGLAVSPKRVLLDDGWLFTQQECPGFEAIIGYMNIKRKKGKILIVNIPIGDYIYTFKWDVNRKK